MGEPDRSLEPAQRRSQPVDVARPPPASRLDGLAAIDLGAQPVGSRQQVIIAAPRNLDPDKPAMGWARVEGSAALSTAWTAPLKPHLQGEPVPIVFAPTHAGNYDARLIFSVKWSDDSTEERTVALSARAVDPVEQRHPEIGPAARERSREPEPHGSPAPAPQDHEGAKFKVEFGHGSVTGAVMLTLEHGKTGVPVGDKLKLLKNTVALKLNGFVMKLETALMNGKLEGEVFDGIKLGLEANVFKVGSDGEKLSADLLTVAVKLSGDVGHWLGAGADLKISLDGQVQFALGGKLAAKLAAQTAANADRILAAADLEAKAAIVAERGRTVGALERKLFDVRHSTKGMRDAPRVEREVAGLERELAGERLQLEQGRKELEALGKGLEAAEKRAASALGRIEGKLARKIAWAMEKKVVGKVLGFLVKALPILNVISMIIDVVDLITMVRALIKYGLGSGDADEGTRHGPNDGADKRNGDGHHGDGHGTEPGDQTPVDGEATKLDPKAVLAARDALPSGARRIYNAVAHGGAKDPELDPDQVRMLGMMVPSDLSSAEVEEVIGQLAAGTKATAAEDVFAAIDTAVREVRDRKCAVSIDGVDRPDIAHPADGPITGPGQIPSDKGPITSPHQLPSVNKGPITSPSQLPAGSGADVSGAAKTYDIETIVRHAPAEYIGHWFALRGGKLVLSDAGARWKAEHDNALVIGMHLKTSETIKAEEPGRWTVVITFNLEDRHTRSQVALDHSYFVSQAETSSGIGARVNGLTFEPFMEVR